MKKSLILINSFLLFICLFSKNITPAFAATDPYNRGNINVYYADAERKPTYTSISHAGQLNRFTVSGSNKITASLGLESLKKSVIYVSHGHGSAGLVQMYNGTYLSGINGNNSNVFSISSLPNGSLNNLKLAIYYACDSGSVSSTYGDIVQQTVNKGANAAVSWKTLLLTTHVNKWNELFFDVFMTKSIVESYRHADYWLRESEGDTAGDNMQLYRNEKGNINIFLNN